MFSGPPQRPLVGRRTSKSQSRLGSVEPPRGLPLQRRVPGGALGAPGGMVVGGGRGLLGPAVMGSQMNEDQHMQMSIELKKAEEKGLRPLVKDEIHAVTMIGQLPNDVQEMVADEINAEQIRAHVDSATGFAMVWSRKTCYVWNCSRRTSSAPTCYSFPCPDPAQKATLLVEAFASLALGSLVNHGPGREPGLLLVSPSGELRLWDTLSLALSGVEKFQTAQLQLRDGEVVRCLETLGKQPGAFVLGTSTSRVFRVAIFAGMSGRPTMLASAMARGWSLFPRWSSATDPKTWAVALAVGAAGAATGPGMYDVWALGADALQRWRVNVAGGEQLLWEGDIRPSVREALVSGVVDSVTATKLELLFHDIKVTSDGYVAVLISYTDIIDDSSIPPHAYAIVVLDVSSPAAPPIVLHVMKPSYRAHLDPRREASPRLTLPYGGPAAFITFADAILVVSLRASSVLEELVMLRESAVNRIVGRGAPVLGAQAGTKSPELVVVTTASGLLKIEVHPGALEGRREDFSPEAVAAKHTAKLRTKLNQAVYFGDDPNNPVTFELRSDFKGDLDAAAEATSLEILASSSVDLPPDSSLNLRNQIAARVRYLDGLINFISVNGLLGKLSQSTRRTLATHAELLNVAFQLWAWQNKRMESSSQPTLLSDAIASWMEKAGFGDHEDPLRLFFKTQVVNICDVLQIIKNTIQDLAELKVPVQQKSAPLWEANELVLIVFGGMLNFRSTHMHTYGLQDNPKEPLSSTPPLLQVLSFQSELTLQIIKQRTHDLGASVDEDGNPFGVSVFSDDSPAQSRQLQGELRRQLTDLADFLLRMFDERLVYLMKSEAPAAEIKDVRAAYIEARPRTIKGLVEVNKAHHAFALGEQYRDFRTLVEMSNGPYGSAQRIETYMEQFQEEFAYELYQWYIEQGRYKDLLDQAPVYNTLLTGFLDSTDYGGIAWIQDMVTRRYEHASAMLVREAIASHELAEQKLMLSIGKLCKVAEATARDLSTDEEYLRNVNGRLDIAEAQRHVSDLCEDALGSEPRLGMQPREEQAAGIAQVLAGQLEDRPAFAQLFTRLVGFVMAGKALASEDLVELYSLKANRQDELGDFGTALDVYTRADEITAGRAQMLLQSLWRRVFIHEDWHVLRTSTSLSDEQISACLRETAVYALLSHIHGDPEELPPTVILTPAQSLFTSTLEDLSARYSDHSLAQLNALLSDYEAENALVQTAIDRDGLGEYVEEIKRLVVVDAEEAHQEGEEMLMEE